VFLEKTRKTISHRGPSSLPVVVAQPDQRHANRTASMLEWYDRHRAYSITSGSDKEEKHIVNLKFRYHIPNERHNH